MHQSLALQTKKKLNAYVNITSEIVKINGRELRNATQTIADLTR